MQLIRFGNTGMRVSRLCLGGMNFSRELDEAQTAQTVDESLDRGVNFIDTADSYGRSEELLGRVLSPAKREKVYLAAVLP